MQLNNATLVQKLQQVLTLINPREHSAPDNKKFEKTI